MMPNQKLANELPIPIIRKLKIRKVYSSFKDNIWGVDLADNESLRKYNKGTKYLLCAIDFFSNYTRVVLLKDKKGVTIIVNGFQTNLDSSKTPNKIRVDQASEFYNNVFKKWLKDHYKEMHSTYNERKSVVAEKVIRTLKNKIFKHMTAVSKKVLYDIGKKYNNTLHSTIKNETNWC